MRVDLKNFLSVIFICRATCVKTRLSCQGAARFTKANFAVAVKNWKTAGFLLYCPAIVNICGGDGFIMRLARICLAAALVLAAQPVAAQESGPNEIKVINEDGSVSVFEMPDSPQDVSVARPLTKMERMLMEQERQAPAAAEEVVPEPEKKAAPAEAVNPPAAVKKAVAL